MSRPTRRCAGSAVLAAAVVLAGQTPVAAVRESGSAADSFAPVTGLRVTAHSGAGCPAGSVTSTTGPDDSLRVAFSAMKLRAAGRTVLSCRLTLDAERPAGWTWAVRQLRYEGEAALVDPVRLQVRAAVGVTSELSTTATATLGSLNGTFALDTAFPPESLTYLPCGMKAFVHTQMDLVLAGVADAPSTVGVQAVAFSPAQFAYRECPPAVASRQRGPDQGGGRSG
ncbi:hypothetical protein GCM10010124_11410 [Pilimelia terevasa]|uniref:Secreted protein n=1 Tax=Pilimelia terevasa TaxID=53372 RepID=A0A8J3BK39_9ACTN|nr:DUF4360 domain-containing protein [Pilimelia terevasa]GGK20519.1 hypothetical protein GCM10010124_11410 [Pilimelia terevasa]